MDQVKTLNGLFNSGIQLRKTTNKCLGEQIWAASPFGHLCKEVAFSTVDHSEHFTFKLNV